MFALNPRGCNCLLLQRIKSFEEIQKLRGSWRCSEENHCWSNLRRQREKGLMGSDSCCVIGLQSPMVACHHIDTWGMKEIFRDPHIDAGRCAL
jgi:hypothetical protein